MDFSSDIMQMMMPTVGFVEPVELEDIFPYNGKTLDTLPQDLEVSLDSPVSLELKHEDMHMGMFRHTTAPASVSPSLVDADNFSSATNMSPSFMEDDQSDIYSAMADRSASISPALTTLDDDLLDMDKHLIQQRIKDHEIFDSERSYSLIEKCNILYERSKCKKYSPEFLSQIDKVEDPEQKVDYLIEFVRYIKTPLPWNYVKCEELHKPYTSASSCKKEKKRDSDGHVNPKRPMNAFMIWSKQCRSLISHICPQLHNATISKKLGVWWRKFTDEEKDVYEREKVKLTAFHAHEFPEYKYRPRKKAPKKTEEKPESGPKEKPSRKRKSSSSKQNQAQQQQQQQQQQQLESQQQKLQQQARQPSLNNNININIGETRASLDPALQRKLQSKMNVKIDPGMRRDVSLSQGSRCTAINLADLSSLHSSDRASSPSPLAKRLCLRPIEVQQTVPPTTIDLADTANRSTVFDTPGNSPLTPVTPVTPNESALGVVASTSQGQPCFDFPLSSSSRVPMLMEQLASTSNNNIIVSTTSSGNQLVFPVGSIYKNSSGSNGNIITINGRINENNNNIILNNNNALLNNNNITVKNESLLLRGGNVFLKSEPLLLQNNTMTLRESLLLHNDNYALKQDALMLQGAATVKQEPLSPQWTLSVKTEADHFSPSFIKSEPEYMPLHSAIDLDSIHQLPMLSADVVDEVLDAGLTSYNNDNLLTDIMTFIGGSSQYESLDGPATV
ncbi:hypothetical protein EGW08_010721 [Elysia chlorotica]|uniref:Sex-determining region Y protein n=1 Tax=Elysia chlorotica TaxID=188477 RepID=A0A3S0ZL62_ELYCH|nr:hypothetical protein EGW08_010721 [Elysia chlorotica]